MKKIIIALLMFLPFTVMAQGNLKIGVFNSQEVMAMMPETNAMMSELENIKLSLSTEIKKLEEEILKKQQEFQALPETTEATIIQYKRTELARLEQSYQEFYMRANENMQKKQQELMLPIINKLQQAIKKVGDENGFTYILDSSTNAVPYISPSADNVTPLIKKALNIQ